MEMTPQEIASTTFRVVKRGFDPDEVRAFQTEAARALESAQSHASLMEQRARAALAKAQAATSAPVAAPTDTSAALAIRAADAEVISRTLVLAQRTAEQTVAEANREAADIRAAAHAEAARALEEARGEAARLVGEARGEARRAGEGERARVMGEVQALLARLDFLREDVHALEGYAAAQRQRLVDAAEALRTVAERPVGGLGDLKRPVLSPAAEMPRAVEAPAPPAVVAAPAAVAPSPVPTVTAPAAAPAPVPADGGEDHDLDELDQLDDEAAGSDTLVLTFSDLPTGEIPRIAPTSGPVAVPEFDDWADEDPATRVRVVRPNDLRVVGDD